MAAEREAWGDSKPSTSSIKPRITSPPKTDLSRKDSLTENGLEHSPKDFGRGLSSVCPFASKQPVTFGESQTVWSPHGSITPRPESPSLSPKPRLTSPVKPHQPPSSVELPITSGDLEACNEDPITAESRNQDTSSPPSVASIPKCPIRFLNQHSPEEVAEYFTKHKHEIPRSHETCVKRYQSNAESIRQLDAKYGNLVSMIEGLGAKHQPLLKTKPLPDTVPEMMGLEDTHVTKIKRWANEVDSGLNHATMGIAGLSHATMGDGDVFQSGEIRGRQPNPGLKDVKLGESPSRPWGIPIRPKKQSSMPYDQSEGCSRLRVDRTSRPRSRTGLSKRSRNDDYSPSAHESYLCMYSACAFTLHNAYEDLEDLARHMLETHVRHPTNPHPKRPSHTSSPEAKPEKAQVVFAGPVFFGYSADQAATLLQQLGSKGPSGPGNSLGPDLGIPRG